MFKIKGLSPDEYDTMLIKIPEYVKELYLSISKAKSGNVWDAEIPFLLGRWGYVLSSMASFNDDKWGANISFLNGEYLKLPSDMKTLPSIKEHLLFLKTSSPCSPKQLQGAIDWWYIICDFCNIDIVALVYWFNKGVKNGFAGGIDFMECYNEVK